MIWKSRAPVRISFAGGGTDIPEYSSEKGGAVVSCTINYYAYTHLELRSDDKIKLKSVDQELELVCRTLDEFEYDGKLDLAKAAVNRLKPKTALSLETFCEAPAGSGLGASSAVTVSILGALVDCFSLDLDRHQIADLAYRVERLDLGMKGGLQDQYASAIGGWNFFEFRGESVRMIPISLKEDLLKELEESLILCDIGRTRYSPGIQSNLAAAYSGGDIKVVELLGALKKLAYEVKDALTGSDLDSFAELLHRSWGYKKALTGGVSNDYVDSLYQMARRDGALGGKLLGAGGGGHMLFFCEPASKHKIINKLINAGGQVRKFSFEKSGLETWKSQPRKSET